MNTRLCREIVHHIFDRFGLLTKIQAPHSFGSLASITQNDHLLDKKLVFVDGDSVEQVRKVWGASCEIGKTVVQILVADTRDDIDEFTILVQVDKLPVYAIQLSEDADDSGQISYHIEHNGKAHWIGANAVVQAKCLIGIESLVGQLLEWKKMTEHKEMFGLLIEFVRGGENELL
jgi:hypothetical protein